jgi:hypothetical protein
MACLCTKWQPKTFEHFINSLCDEIGVLLLAGLLRKSMALADVSCVCGVYLAHSQLGICIHTQRGLGLLLKCKKQHVPKNSLKCKNVIFTWHT